MATQIRNIGTPLSPAMAVFQNFLYMATRRPENNEVNFLRYDGRQWAELGSVPGVRTGSQPSLAVFQNKLYLAVRGEDNFLYLSAFDGARWSPPQIVPGTGKTLAAPNLTQYGNLLHLTYTSELGYRLMWVSFNPNFRYGTYIVKPGQRDLAAVSLALFGNANRAREIAALNHIEPIPGTGVYPVSEGDVLLVPA